MKPATLDPFFRHQLHLIADIRSLDEVQTDPEKGRRMQQWLADPYPTPPPCHVSVDQLDTGAGVIEVRTCRPPPARDRQRLLIWCHGGGFVSGDLDMPEADGVARELASEHGVTVMTPAYSLAADATSQYPTPHHQVLGVLDWASRQARQLGIDRDQVNLGGASAGATIAMSACFELRRRGLPMPSRLLMAYPFLHREVRPDQATDDLLHALPIALRFPQFLADQLFGRYLGTAVDTEFASLEGNSLRGFPPSMVAVAEFDDLRSSGERFVQQSNAEGTEALLHLSPGTVHGYLNRSRTVSEISRTLARFAGFLA
ncbi:alpha/beta hydrolase [Glaciibacter flavus]|uniref:Alpha/beta hydrolase n=1 Tax=Orlajensenia flava TaxID=2565934 RepID=A0A4S4FHA7_9MICO|nr:alpha/beta hydrolase fold domain-containing protein [Glaciibacter flavus]THG29124.1 alpha/beta hydrolase [Glaciibacter flavus]